MGLSHLSFPRSAFGRFYDYPSGIRLSKLSRFHGKRHGACAHRGAPAFLEIRAGIVSAGRHVADVRNVQNSLFELNLFCNSEQSRPFSVVARRQNIRHGYLCCPGRNRLEHHRLNHHEEVRFPAFHSSAQRDRNILLERTSVTIVRSP